MNTQAVHCACVHCVGAACTCGCQAPARVPSASCQCGCQQGKACQCGPREPAPRIA